MSARTKLRLVVTFPKERNQDMSPEAGVILMQDVLPRLRLSDQAGLGGGRKVVGVHHSKAVLENGFAQCEKRPPHECGLMVFHFRVSSV
jgi:hypothetical protein